LGAAVSARYRFAEAIATFDRGTQKLGINVLALIGLGGPNRRSVTGPQTSRAPRA
jgi:hypothetical protein